MREPIPPPSPEVFSVHGNHEPWPTLVVRLTQYKLGYVKHFYLLVYPTITLAGSITLFVEKPHPIGQSPPKDSTIYYKKRRVEVGIFSYCGLPYDSLDFLS